MLLHSPVIFGERMFDGLKDNEKIEEAVATGVKTIVWGAIIIGGILFVEKIFDFGFEIAINLGL